MKIQLSESKKTISWQHLCIHKEITFENPISEIEFFERTKEIYVITAPNNIFSFLNLAIYKLNGNIVNNFPVPYFHKEIECFNYIDLVNDELLTLYFSQKDQYEYRVDFNPIDRVYLAKSRCK